MSIIDQLLVSQGRIHICENKYRAPLEVATSLDLQALCCLLEADTGFSFFNAFYFSSFVPFLRPYLVLVHGCNEKGEGDGCSCHGVGGGHPILCIRPHLQLHDRW